MKLDRPLFLFDTETTGTDPVKDRIVQLSFTKVFHPSGHAESRQRYINPGIPIPAETTAVHGITDAMVCNEPTFRQVARSLFDYIQDCDVAGYNIRRFDVPLLCEEFARAGVEWDPRKNRIIDLYLVWQKMEPRKLVNAIRHFVDSDFDGDLHDAEKDTAAAGSVLEAMLKKWEMEPAALADMSVPTFSHAGEEMPYVDLGNCLARRGDGEVVYTHQKVRGVRVLDDPGYGRWMLKQSFGSDTKRVLEAFLGGQF